MIRSSPTPRATVSTAYWRFVSPITCRKQALLRRKPLGWLSLSFSPLSAPLFFSPPFTGKRPLPTFISETAEHDIAQTEALRDLATRMRFELAPVRIDSAGQASTRGRSSAHQHKSRSAPAAGIGAASENESGRPDRPEWPLSRDALHGQFERQHARRKAHRFL